MIPNGSSDVDVLKARSTCIHDAGLSGCDTPVSPTRSLTCLLSELHLDATSRDTESLGEGSAERLAAIPSGHGISPGNGAMTAWELSCSSGDSPRWGRLPSNPGISTWSLNPSRRVWLWLMATPGHQDVRHRIAALSQPLETPCLAKDQRPLLGKEKLEPKWP